ncbi:MAG: thiol:disulfide interchange protein DsbA/DsbL [Xanthomonadaceae bacterium]|nr:thiol:disulfide interchange protein DsbA/DsbL [Xanthomonadaceae bacterium]
MLAEQSDKQKQQEQQQAPEPQIDGASAKTPIEFVEGVHFVRLDKPVPTVDPDKIEVIEAFSYGCPYCFELEPLIMRWEHEVPSYVDFRRLHAVWNEPMRLYAQAFYAAILMGIIDRVHVATFNAVQIEQRRLASPRAFADFVAEKGHDRDEYIRHFGSSETRQAVKSSEQRVELYGISGVPQFIVNGKYRVDPARADGREAMLDVVNFLVARERKAMLEN